MNGSEVINNMNSIYLYLNNSLVKELANDPFVINLNQYDVVQLLYYPKQSGNFIEDYYLELMQIFDDSEC